MSKTWRYIAANLVLVLCLAVYYDSEEALWMFLAVAGGLAIAVNLLVFWVGPKGDGRKV